MRRPRRRKWPDEEAEDDLRHPGATSTVTTCPPTSSSATPFNLLGDGRMGRRLHLHQLHRLLRREAPGTCSCPRRSRTRCSRASRRSSTTSSSTRRWRPGQAQGAPREELRAATWSSSSSTSRPRSCARSSACACAFPSAQLRTRIDNKIMTTRIGNEAGVKSVPNALARVTLLRPSHGGRQAAPPRGPARRADRLRRLRAHDLLHRRRARLQGARRRDRGREGGQGHEAGALPGLRAGGVRHPARHPRGAAHDRAGGLQGADALQGRMVRQRGLPRRVPAEGPRLREAVGLQESARRCASDATGATSSSTS